MGNPITELVNMLSFWNLLYLRKENLHIRFAGGALVAGFMFHHVL